MAVQGVVKQLLSFSDIEGHPACMDVCGQYFAVGTNRGAVKLFDLGRRYAQKFVQLINAVVNGFILKIVFFYKQPRSQTSGRHETVGRFISESGQHYVGEV